MKRHRQLKQDLQSVGYKGAVMSFDWPSADSPLNYLEDRHDAKITAMQLVTDGIRLLAKNKGPIAPLIYICLDIPRGRMSSEKLSTMRMMPF